MGAGASTISVSIKKGIESDYNRVKQDPERDYIVSRHRVSCEHCTACSLPSIRLIATVSQVLEEVCMVRPPPGIPITFSSLGVLYATDKNGDGRFSLQELYEFAQLCDTQRKLVQSYEFQVSLLACRLLLAMWRLASTVALHATLHGWRGLSNRREAPSAHPASLSRCCFDPLHICLKLQEAFCCICVHAFLCQRKRHPIFCGISCELTLLSYTPRVSESYASTVLVHVMDGCHK